MIHEYGDTYNSKTTCKNLTQKFTYLLSQLTYLSLFSEKVQFKNFFGATANIVGAEFKKLHYSF